MYQSIIRYLIAYGLAYLVGHGVITKEMADANLAAVVNTTIIVLGIVGTIIWSYMEKDYKGVLDKYFPNQGSSSGPSSPTSKTPLLVLAASVMAVTLTGCAGTLPSQFENANPPLSATDTKVVEGLASFDTPAALLSIETGAGTVTSIGMYVSIKQTSTMQSDGLLLFGAGQELQALTSGTVGTSGSINDIFTGLKANASTTQSATNFTTIASGLNGLVSAAQSYVQSAAASTTNPSVAAYATTVFTDDLHAIGKGVCDVTSQYAPVVLSLRLPPHLAGQQLAFNL